MPAGQLAFVQEPLHFRFKFQQAEVLVTSGRSYLLSPLSLPGEAELVGEPLESRGLLKGAQLFALEVLTRDTSTASGRPSL